MTTLSADASSVGIRVDIFLAREMQLSRAEAQRLLQGGHARLNGRPCTPGVRLREGDVLAVVAPESKPAELVPEPIELDILLEDSHLLVINKPRGMVVHPSPGHSASTLVHAILGHAQNLSGIGGAERPGIVHRLDRDTSGVLVVAKTEEAHRSLQSQIEARTAKRTYLALVWGHPKFEKAVVEAPIGRHPADRKRMAVITDARYRSREAITHLRVLERLGPFVLLEAGLETGRTHQIRVHCQYIGHPVAGDPVYGGVRKIPAKSLAANQLVAIEQAIHDLGGQALHAQTLCFRHPATGEEMSFEAPLPAPLENLLGLIRSALPKGRD